MCQTEVLPNPWAWKHLNTSECVCVFASSELLIPEYKKLRETRESQTEKETEIEREKAFLHCQAGTIAAWQMLQLHCLASLNPRGSIPPSSRSRLSWFIGVGWAEHGDLLTIISILYYTERFFIAFF